MDIEETLNRESYRGYDLVHRTAKAPDASRWHITHKESGMNRSYGFAASQSQAHRTIDDLLKYKA
jgi:hypothetical protein